MKSSKRSTLLSIATAAREMFEAGDACGVDQALTCKRSSEARSRLRVLVMGSRITRVRVASRDTRPSF